MMQFPLVSARKAQSSNGHGKVFSSSLSDSVVDDVVDVVDTFCGVDSVREVREVVRASMEDDVVDVVDGVEDVEDVVDAVEDEEAVEVAVVDRECFDRKCSSRVCFWRNPLLQCVQVCVRFSICFFMW